MVCETNRVSCQPVVTFQGVCSIADDQLLNILEANFKHFFDWSFLALGAWFDADNNQFTIHSPSVPQSRLLPVADESYVDGQVWQGIRKDWVYETGCFNGACPIQINLLTVDGVVHTHPNGDFTINYPDGRVIFDTPQNIAAEVLLEHSYRNIQVYRASDASWFSEIQHNTFYNDNLDISRTEDGTWSIGSNHRIQLPAIIIDPISRSSSTPHAIGSRELVISQDIGFYVLAETKNQRNKILDIIRLQQGQQIQLYDTNEVAKNEDYPLGPNLDKNINGLMYPDLVKKHPYRRCYLKTINLYEIEAISSNFHQGLARANVEIVL